MFSVALLRQFEAIECVIKKYQSTVAAKTNTHTHSANVTITFYTLLNEMRKLTGAEIHFAME